MEVQIKARGLPAAKNLRNHASRRIRTALGRFGHAVQSVTVRLSDINGPAAEQTSSAASSSR
jgi:hypothetical protein